MLYQQYQQQYEATFQTSAQILEACPLKIWALVSPLSQKKCFPQSLNYLHIPSSLSSPSPPSFLNCLDIQNPMVPPVSFLHLQQLLILHPSESPIFSSPSPALLRTGSGQQETRLYEKSVVAPFTGGSRKPGNDSQGCWCILRKFRSVAWGIVTCIWRTLWKIWPF